MKRYYHKLDGRRRFMGYSTGDTDLSIGYFNGDKFIKENTHIHRESDEIYIPVKGMATIWVNGKILRLRPGMPLRVEKGEPHCMLSIFRGPLEIYVIKVPDKYDDKIIIETPRKLNELIHKHGLR